MQLFISGPLLSALGAVPAVRSLHDGRMSACSAVAGHFLCFPSDGVKFRLA